MGGGSHGALVTLHLPLLGFASFLFFLFFSFFFVLYYKFIFILQEEYPIKL